MTDWDGMSDGELMRRLEQLQAQVSAVADAEEIVRLEQLADEIPPLPYSPYTAHPIYEQHAAFVRQLMAQDEYMVRVPDARKPLHRLISEPEPNPLSFTDNTLTLEVRRRFSTAPFVGEEYRYVWRVAVDKYERWIGDDVVEVWRT